MAGFFFVFFVVGQIEQRKKKDQISHLAEIKWLIDEWRSMCMICTANLESVSIDDGERKYKMRTS